jgi:uncharacterized membrane protein
MKNPKPNAPEGYHSPHSLAELTEENVRAISDLEKASRSKETRSDRFAAIISRFCGSMPFFWAHVIFFTGWIVGNTILFIHPIDPYPFNFLTLIVSLEAIFLSTFIMIAENRQEHLAERRNKLDLQINLLTEQENTKGLHLLKAIAEKLGIDPSGDPTVGILEQATQPEQVAEQIEKSEKDE